MESKEEKEKLNIEGQVTKISSKSKSKEEACKFNKEHNAGNAVEIRLEKEYSNNIYENTIKNE